MEQTTVIKKGKGVNLIYKSYRHKKGRSHGGKQHWRCVEQGCPGRVHTKTGCQEDDHPSVLYSVEHNHMADQEQVLALKIKAKVCQLAAREPLQSLCSVYKEFIASNLASENEDGVTVPDFQACRSQMHRARRARRPPVSTTSDGINLDVTGRPSPEPIKPVLKPEPGLSDDKESLSANTSRHNFQSTEEIRRYLFEEDSSSEEEAVLPDHSFDNFDEEMNSED